MIRSDQLASALDVLAGHEVRKAQDAAPDAVARLDDGDVVAGARQLIGRGKPAETAADHDHASRLSPEPRSASRSLSKQARSGGERALNHVAAADAVAAAYRR